MYTEDSSICVSAIHSGLLNRGGDVTIRIIAAPNEFEGNNRNGISSSSSLGIKRERAFLVESATRQCRMEVSRSSSFLELGTSHPAAPPAGTGGLRLLVHQEKGTQALGAAPDEAVGVTAVHVPLQGPSVNEGINEPTTMAINHLSTILSQQQGSSDADVVEHIKLAANKVRLPLHDSYVINRTKISWQAISGTRSNLKPAEIVEMRLQVCLHESKRHSTVSSCPLSLHPKKC